MNKTKKDSTLVIRKTRIMVVDDHPIVRDGLALLIQQEADMIVCAKAGNNAEAVRVVKKHRIDLAIVDVLLKTTTGIETTKKIKSLCPNLRVLMFSMSDDLWHVKQAFAAGAKGYITKDEITEEIVNAIRRIRKGEIYITRRLIKNMSKEELDSIEFVFEG